METPAKPCPSPPAFHKRGGPSLGQLLSCPVSCLAMPSRSGPRHCGQLAPNLDGAAAGNEWLAISKSPTLAAPSRKQRKTMTAPSRRKEIWRAFAGAARTLKHAKSRSRLVDLNL